MAKQARKTTTRKKAPPRRASKKPPRQWGMRLRRGFARGALGLLGAVLLALFVMRFFGPVTTHTIWSESRRLDAVEWEWVPISEIAPVAARAVVAAEDANFCAHWGFDMGAIRAAIDAGARRGASTISQQTVKNVFLWQGRSWPRKAMEAILTPLVELAWPKRRILEVYLNVAEWGEGIFGIEAAARNHFGVAARDLTPAQAAALAVVLPNPKGRNPTALPPGLRRRAGQVEDGAALIHADGRALCFSG